MIVKRLFLIAFILLVPVSAHSATATEVLKRAQSADRQISYRGTKTATVSMGGRAATSKLKVIHMMPDKTRTEFVTPRFLTGVIIIRNGRNMWRYDPHGDFWQEGSFRHHLSSNMLRQVMRSNYTLEIIGSEEIAGRKTHVIQASPRGSNDSPRKIWVDQNSYIVMATQVEDGNGVVINSSRYTSIEINPTDISPSLFQVDGKIKESPKPSSVHFIVVRPRYLPEGYKLIGESTMSVNGSACAHTQFSNGSNVISLFQRQGDEDREPARVKSKTIHALTWSRSKMSFTILGNLPWRELHKIADSTP